MVVRRDEPSAACHGWAGWKGCKKRRSLTSDLSGNFCVRQVAFADELVQEFLLDAAAELQTLCSSAAPAEAAADGNGGGNGAKHARKRIRSLLLRMEGVVVGARTCLPDFEHSAPQGATSLL